MLLCPRLQQQIFAKLLQDATADRLEDIAMKLGGFITA